MAFSRDLSKNDLTVGPIIRKLLMFFLPIAAGTMFQQLYNAVDAFVVCKFVGTDSLAAVAGSPATNSNLVIGFCVALTSGASVIISQYFGAKNERAVTVGVRTSMLFCLVLGLVVGAVVMLISPWLLTIEKTPADSFDLALLYQEIYFAGTALTLLFNMGCGILRAVGDSRFPFICLFISCGINVVLDVLLVAVIPLGVMGVAIATVFAQAVCAAMVIIKLLRSKECYRLVLHGVPFDFTMLKRMLGIGLPAGAQNSMYGVSNSILQVAVNSLGTATVASWALAGKVDGFYWAISGAFAAAITAFIGQNYGAAKYDRVSEAGRKGIAFFTFMTGCFSVLLLTVGKLALGLLSDDPAVIASTYHIMLRLVPYYAIWSFIEACSGILRGLNDAVIPAVLIGISVCGFRIVWILFVFSRISTIEIICASYPISWTLAAASLIVYYVYRMRKLRKKWGIAAAKK